MTSKSLLAAGGGNSALDGLLRPCRLMVVQASAVSARPWISA
jgi:hypothetical protein